MKNLETNAPARLHPIDRHFFDETVLQITFSPVEDSASVITADGKLHKVSSASLKRPLSIEAHKAGVLCAQWSPDGLLLASGGQDGILRIWRTEDFHLLSECQLGSQWIEHIAWQSPSSRAVAMGKRLFSCEVQSASHSEIFISDATISGLAVQGRNELLITSYGKALRLSSNDNIFTVSGSFQYPEAMLALELSPNGKLAARMPQHVFGLSMIRMKPFKCQAIMRKSKSWRGTLRVKI